MCCFLAFGVRDAELTDVRGLCPRDLHVDPCINRSVVRAFGGAFHAYWLTSGHCSCNLAPSPEAETTWQPPSEQRLRKKYQARGWSAAKIERAVADALSATGKNRHPPGLRSHAAEFLAAVAGRFGNVKFMIHWFDGALDVDLVLTSGRQFTPATLVSDPVGYDRCHAVIA